MTLFSEAGYEEAMRNLVEGLSWASGWKEKWEVPTKSAIFYARARLGVEPVRPIFAHACVPLATPAVLGTFYRGWGLVSADGTALDVADTADNDAEFGWPGSGRGGGRVAYPQLRVVALAECGTQTLFGAAPQE